MPTARVDRRRPGRRDQVAPALIGLLRGTAPALDGEWALPLDPARGLLTAVAFGLLGWAVAAWMVTRLLG